MSKILVEELLIGGRNALQKRAVQRVALQSNNQILLNRAQRLDLVESRQFVQLKQKYYWIGSNSDTSYTTSNISFKGNRIQEDLQREKELERYVQYTNKVAFFNEMLVNMTAKNPMMNMDGNLSQIPDYMQNCLLAKNYKGIDAVESILEGAIEEYFKGIEIELTILDKEITMAINTIEKNIFLFLLFQHEHYYNELAHFFKLIKGLNEGKLIANTCFSAPKTIELDPNADASKALVLVKAVQKELMRMPKNQTAIAIIARKPQALTIIRKETTALTLYKEKCTSLVLLPKQIPSLEERPILEGKGIVAETGNFLSAIWNAGTDYQTLKTLYGIKSSVDTILEGVSATAINIGALLDGVSIVSYLLKGSYGIYQAGGINNWSKMILSDMLGLKDLLKNFCKNPNSADLKKILLLIAAILAFLEMLNKVAKKVNEKEIYDDWKKTRDDLSQKLDELEKGLSDLKKDKTTHATTIQSIETVISSIQTKIDDINKNGEGAIMSIISAFKAFFSITDATKIELTQLKATLNQKNDALTELLKKIDGIDDKIKKAEANQQLLLQLQSDSDWTSIFDYHKVIDKTCKGFEDVVKNPTLEQVSTSIKSVKSIGITKADLDKLKQDIAGIS